MPYTLYEVNAFTANGRSGNPAGVVLDADGLTEQDMQALATEAGFAETAFVRAHDQATYELRFFTQTNEVDICGHATIAAWSLMHQKGLLDAGEYTQQTLAGLLRISVLNSGLVFMQQNKADLYEKVPVSEILSLVEADKAMFPETLKPQIVSTGIRDLLIPVSDKAVLGQLVPNLEKIAEFSRECRISGLHFFSIPDGETESVASARNFAPADGIDEEAATGTANGALLCYLKRYNRLPGQEIYRIEQGENMGRLSYIFGKFVSDTVWIGGEAVVAGSRPVMAGNLLTSVDVEADNV